MLRGSMLAGANAAGIDARGRGDQEKPRDLALKAMLRRGLSGKIHLIWPGGEMELQIR